MKRFSNKERPTNNVSILSLGAGKAEADMNIERKES
jgi:hypothetical protein